MINARRSDGKEDLLAALEEHRQVIAGIEAHARDAEEQAHQCEQRIEELACPGSDAGTAADELDALRRETADYREQAGLLRRRAEAYAKEYRLAQLEADYASLQAMRDEDEQRAERAEFAQLLDELDIWRRQCIEVVLTAETLLARLSSIRNRFPGSAF